LAFASASEKITGANRSFPTCHLAPVEAQKDIAVDRFAGQEAKFGTIGPVNVQVIDPGAERATRPTT
jgi:hypothetical protein